MGPKRRRSSPWPLLLFSVLLLLAPSSLTQKVQLTTLSGFIPFQGLGRWTLGLFHRVTPSSGSAATLRAELDFVKDELLKKANEEKRLRLQLEQALGMKQPIREQNYRLILADVLFPTDSSPWRKSLTIALGTRDGVEKGMLVVYNNQVVGRVTETGPKTSRILTVTDPGFRAGAIAVPRNYVAGVSFGDRHPGVYEGTAGQNGQLKWLSGETPVENDALVLTTEDPVNGIPRGLILGRVSAVNMGRGAFPRVDVEPVLNFGALEHVMLLVPPPEPQAPSAKGKP